MDDRIIIKIEDVREKHPVSTEIQSFDAWAREAQMGYVQPLIGDALYKKLMDSPADALITKLVEGGTYGTGDNLVIYRGLRAYACYIWLYLYSIHASAKLTPIGTMAYTDPDSEHAGAAKAGKALTEHFKAIAGKLEASVEAFLAKHAGEYPEYRGRSKTAAVGEGVTGAGLYITGTANRYNRIR